MKTPRRTKEQPTARFLREQVRRLFVNLPGARAGEEEPIHQVRVASRRLRAALPLAARKPAGRRVRRAVKGLRALTRLAGEGRDLDVCAGIFEEEAPRAGLPDSFVRVLRQRLQVARASAHRKLAQALASFDAAKLRVELDTIITRGGAELDDTTLMLAAALDQQARASLAELREVGSQFDPVALHALRRRVRRLRYLAELNQALFKGSMASVKSLKHLQEILGQLHDAFVLADWIAQAVAMWEAQGKGQQAAAARAIKARLQDRAQTLHRRFLAARPAVRLHKVLAAGTRS